MRTQIGLSLLGEEAFSLGLGWGKRPMPQNVKVTYWRQESPVGHLFVVKTSKGVCAIRFRQDKEKVFSLIRKTFGREVSIREKRDRRISRQLDQYFQGKRTRFTIPIDLCFVEGFTREVLETLLDQVAFGRTISYGMLATKVGRPHAARAVGQAMRVNPVPVIIPCHRVVASDGSLGGYVGGLRKKEILLSIEQRG